MPESTYVIDSKEAKTHTAIAAELRRRLPTADQIHDNLTFADYSFFGSEFPGLDHEPSIGIELSSVTDILGKMNSGRFQYQMNGMLESFDIRILLIQGTITADHDGFVRRPGTPSRMQYDRVMSILDAAGFHGIVVRYVSTPSDAAARIATWFKYWQKPYKDHKLFTPMEVSRDVARDLRNYLPVGEGLDKRVQSLATWDGLGPKGALNALKQFGSIETLAILPEEAWKTVDGIGNVTAKAVREFVTTAPTWDLDA